MQDAAAQIRAYMDQHGLTQRQMAQRAQVSQPSVSRALKGKPLRHGAARTKLFTTVGINESTVPRELSTPQERIMAAFGRIWDHTDAHADAIAEVIDALGKFRPASLEHPGG